MSEEILIEEQEENQTTEVDSNNQHPYDLPGEWFVLNAQSGHENKEQEQQQEQGAVKLDNEKVSDMSLEISPGSEAVLKVGKRKFLRIKA